MFAVCRALMITDGFNGSDLLNFDSACCVGGDHNPHVCVSVMCPFFGPVAADFVF